jgi:hypothetical protein
MSMRLLSACLVVAMGGATGASEWDRGATLAGAGIPATPLQKLSSTRAPIGDYFAWAGQALCDENRNSYFLVVQPVAPGRKLKEPRAVLRVSADGKKRLSFTPADVSELASAHELRTLSFALDPDGGLFLLVWAESGGRTGQYIVSFDPQGGYRRHFEIDSRRILVDQFEAFGASRFLLRGRWPDRPEARLAILSAGGREIEDVVGWPGQDEPLEQPSLENQASLRLDQITRGADGRIYLADLDARKGEDVVYAVDSSGDSREVFTLRPMPLAPRLLGWKAAGHRFAAAYGRDEPTPGASPGEHRGRYWIAVYSNPTRGRGLEPTVYGPAPGPPICYRHDATGDRFTFLQEGSLVTMSAP